MSDPGLVAALKAEADRQRREGTPFSDQSIFLREMGISSGAGRERAQQRDRELSEEVWRRMDDQDTALPRREVLFEALTLVMEPGENVGYSEVLRRLNERIPSFDTAGIGSDLADLVFRGYTRAWRGSDFVTYRVPFFDYENEGNWVEGELRIVRKDVGGGSE